MELKLSTITDKTAQHNLLIVPYGIETHRTDPKKPAPARLLIVPYGIETNLKPHAFKQPVMLLIVPYGIETANWRGRAKPPLCF